MAIIRSKRFSGFVFITLSLLLLGACTTTKSKYHKEYAKVWDEIINSEAWKKSLLANVPEPVPNEPELYASASTAVIKEDSYRNDWDMEGLFHKRYGSLISRAYFKIISEAEKADSRITKEHLKWKRKQGSSDVKKDKEYKREYALVLKKYQAHKEMLEGLKSWNIFHEYRTNDLDFFKAENEQEVRHMYLNGSSDENMINFLVYKLADLYHDEDQ